MSKQAQSYSLAGQIFLVLEGPKVLAQGTIQHTFAEHHMVNFSSGCSRIMSNASLEQGLLFSSVEQANTFLQQYMGQFDESRSASESAGNTSPCETEGDGGVNPEAAAAPPSNADTPPALVDDALGASNDILVDSGNDSSDGEALS